MLSVELGLAESGPELLLFGETEVNGHLDHHAMHFGGALGHIGAEFVQSSENQPSKYERAQRCGYPNADKGIFDDFEL